MTEVWNKIPNIEGCEASNYGNVRHNGAALKSYVNGSGYAVNAYREALNKYGLENRYAQGGINV